MRVPVLALPLVLVAGLGGPVAQAGEEPKEQVFPWPVAAFDVPSPKGALLGITLTSGGTSRTVLVRPQATLVLEWAERSSRRAPDAQATLDLLLGTDSNERKEWRATDTGGRLVLISGPGDLGALAERVPPPASEGGTFALRIVVRPGDEQAFYAFRSREARNWRDAQSMGQSYEPSTKTRYVAPRADADTEQDTSFEVLETPASPEEDFDGTTIDRASVGRGDGGEPLTLFEISAPRRTAFEAWTRKNVGLPMAIVLDGRVVSAPTIQSPLSDSVQVTLGKSSMPEARAQAQDLMATLLKARAAGLRIALVAGPWSAGRRFVYVPLPGPQPVDVRIGVEGQAPGALVRAHHWQAVPTLDQAVEGLHAALALGATDSHWARALVARFERPALLAALRAQHAGSEHGQIRAGCLDLLGRFGSEDPESARLILSQYLLGTPLEQATAVRVLARESSWTPALFDALEAQAATGEEADRRELLLLLRPMVPRFFPGTLALLDDPRHRVRELGVQSLRALRDVPPDALRAHGVGRRLMAHEDTRVQAVGVWARLLEEAEGSPPSHEALHLAAWLRDERVRADVTAQTSDPRFILGAVDPVEVNGPAIDRLDVVTLLRMQVDREWRRLGENPDVPSLGAPVLQRCVWWLTLDRLSEPVPTPTEAWLSLLQDPDMAVRALATGASAQLRLIPPRVRARWSALRTDTDVDVRVLARAALLLHGAAEAGDRADVEGFLKRRADWRWAPMVREFLRQAPKTPN